jgi:hypothetical protein
MPRLADSGGAKNRCRNCGGSFCQKISGDENGEVREYACRDCKVGFRWTTWKKNGKLTKKLYEVLEKV